MSCTTTTFRYSLGAVERLMSGGDCGFTQKWFSFDRWRVVTAGGSMVLHEENDLLYQPCAPSDSAEYLASVAEAQRIWDAARATGAAMLLAHYAANLAENERIVQALDWSSLPNSVLWDIVIERFTCPSGEEPPPWGQPPYNPPGAPGTCEYADSLECEQPNQKWLSLVVDSHGVPVIEDCSFPTFTYCHAPCDTTFGPPPASVLLPLNATAGQIEEAHRLLIQEFVPDARDRMLALGCPWIEPMPPLDAPVTLHMSESLTGVFADPTVDATFFSLVDLPVGSGYSIGDQISGRAWYTGVIRDKSIQGGLTSYSLETLLATIGRVTPREALVLVAGEGGVPNPLTLRECLVRFLDYYGVPYNPDIPEFYLRAGEELVVPTVPAFVIQPDQLNPASIYAQLEPFYGVFRSYTFRADEQNRLVVTPPAWVDTIGLRLNLWRRRQENDRTPGRQTNGVPWSTTRRPIVEWMATVDGVTYSGALPAPLELGAPLQDVHIGPVTVRIQWRASDNRVQASIWPPPPIDLTIGNLYSIAFTLRPETLPGDEDELLQLTEEHLGPNEVQTTSADTVINKAVIPVRARTFQPAQQVMQATAMVLASPGGLMPGLFGNTPFGPMDEELETPNGFLELVNDTVQEGAWFWPADETVVIQPGGNITVAYDVEEWAEQWRSPSAPHAAASQVNTYSDTVDLPANGAEVRLFDFQFPRQTTNTAPSPYGARGTVWGRWRAGETPGIELRVGNSHFVEFGYLPEMGIFGQTVYFLWGAIVKLNGTGTTFTVGDLHTYRFGFSRGADGLWEDGANMPGLSESQALFPNRVYTAPELPYEVTPEVALAMARGIVEENLTPKVVHTLTVPPSGPGGYAVGPWHMGRAADIPALGVRGRVTSLDYSEAHTAQAQGDTSTVTIDVETTTAPAGSRAAATGYRRAAYGLSHYQQEE